MRFIKDVILNFISSLSLVFMVQALYFPIVANSESTQVFGEYIYIYTLINFWAAVIGGVGNSIYLKYYSSFSSDNKINEYRSILGGLLINFILSIPILFFILDSKLSVFDLLIVMFTALFVIYRIYLRTWYRAMLKYAVILYGNLITAAAYGVMILTGMYEYNFFLTILLSEVCFTAFILLFSKNINLVKPLLLKKSYIKGYIFLFVSFIAVTAFKYVDKWFIEYEFDSAMLSYFYIAAITSTLFTAPITTLSNVLFSYFVQREHLSLNTIYKTFIFVVVAPLIIITTGYFIGPIIIHVLYEQYYTDSIQFFYILNIAFGLLSIDFILRGFVVKFYPEYFKMLMDILMLIILIGGMILLSNIYGMFGVAYSMLLTYAIKAIIDFALLILYYKRTKTV